MDTKVMDGYLAIFLTEESQKLLLSKLPPTHPKVYAHHVTVAFKPTVDVYEYYKKYLGQKIALRVYGYTKDEKGEAVVVDTDILEDKKQHITLSTNNTPPFYSKILVEKGFATLGEPFLLQAVFEFIEHN
jgi:hypothetical protein